MKRRNNFSLTSLELAPANPEDAPLLIMLHGYGSNEKDLIQIAPALLPEFRYISPRAPLTMDVGMYGWFPLEFTPGGITVDYKAAQHALEHFDEAAAHHFSEIAAAMMLALAIHCTADGVALAAGHEAEASHSPGGRALDFSLIMAICVHKVPEGLALGALLLGAGFNRAQTLMRVTAVESTTVLGAVLGWVFLHHISTFWLDATVAHVGGGFLFLAVHAVFGEIMKHHKALVLSNFALGFGAIGVLSLLLRLL